MSREGLRTADNVHVYASEVSTVEEVVGDPLLPSFLRSYRVFVVEVRSAY